MAAYPIPNPQYGIYNQNNFSKNPTGQDGLTLDTAKLYFLQFPNAQTTQTEYLHDIGVSGTATFEGAVTFNDTVTYNQDIEYTQNVLVDGDVTIMGNTLAETGTFQDVLTCEKGIDISVSPYGITFPDNTTQTTAFIEANYAQLNTDNTFLAPYQQTFAGDSSTGNTNAPIKITNGVPNKYCSLYLDPNSGNDITLYTNQNPGGGLTIRGANTQSFTMNPMAVQDGTGCQFLNPVDMNGSSLSGLLNVYSDNSTITFRDSSVNPMLQLTTTGHTSYENLDMNTNYISNVDNVSFKSPVGNSGTASFQNNVNQNGGTYFVLSTNQGISIAINGVERTRYNGTNIQFYNPVILPTGSTGVTQQVGTNDTTLATTAFVIANTPTPQSLANYAQLNTGTAQTFTGPISFTSNVQYKGNIIATIDQLPQFTQSYLFPYVLSTIDPSYGSINLNTGTPYQETQQLSLSSSAQASFFSNPVCINFGAVSGLPVMTPILALQFNAPNSTTSSNPIRPWANYPPPNAYYYVYVQTGSISQSWPVSFFQNGPYSFVVFYSYYNMGANTTGYYDFSSLGLIPA